MVFFYAAFSFVMLFSAFLDLGLGYTANVLIAKYDISPEYHCRKTKIFTLIFIIKVILGTIVLVFLLFSSTWLVNNYFNYPAGKLTFIILSISLLSSILAGFCYSILSALKDFKISSILQNISAIISFILIIVFINKIGILAPAISFVLNGFFVLIVGLVYISKKHNLTLHIKLKSDNAVIKELWSVGKWIAFGTAGLNILYYIDTIMLTMLTNLKSVALYNIALPIMQIFQSLLIFPTVFIPIASSLWAKGEKKEIAFITNHFISFSIGAVWTTLLFTFSFGKNIISILFSVKYIDANNALIILCSGVVCYSLALFILGVLNCSGNEKQGTYIIIIGIILNVTLNLLLIPFLGIVGAALATSSSYLLILLIGIIKILKIITNIIFPWRLFITTSIAGFSSLLLLYYFRHDKHTASISVLIIFLIILATQLRHSIKYILNELNLFKPNNG